MFYEEQDYEVSEYTITPAFEKMTVVRLVVDVLAFITLAVVNYILKNWTGVVAAIIGLVELLIVMAKEKPNDVMFHLMMSSVLLFISIGSMLLFI